jgi:hypothetical protein
MAELGMHRKNGGELMKVTLRNGTVYPHGLSLNYKEGGKVELAYHDKLKVNSPKRDDDIDKFRYFLKTVELDAGDLVSVTDYSHD